MNPSQVTRSIVGSVDLSQTYFEKPNTSDFLQEAMKIQTKRQKEHDGSPPEKLLGNQFRPEFNKKKELINLMGIEEQQHSKNEQS